MECGADANHVEASGFIPLILACKLKRTAISVVMILKQLKDEGICNIDFDITDENGNTALHYACITENFDLIKILVEQCDANAHISNR